MTHSLGSGSRTPPDVQCEGVARLFEVRVRVMTLCGEAAAVKACQTDVDAHGVVLWGARG